MRMRLWSAAAIVMLAATSTALAADSPWTGKWKMDPAQSKLTGDTIRFAEGTGGEMMSTSQGHTSKFKMDGNPYKTWSGDEVRWKKIDDNTFEQHVKVNGIDVATNTWTISQDGKTLKIESKGKTPDGKSFDDTSVYTRISGTKGLMGAWKSTKAEVSAPEVWNIIEKGPNELIWDIETIKGRLDATLDGKDIAPVGPTVPKGLTVAVTRVSPKVLKLTLKMNGEVSERATMTISADGKRITDVGITPKTGETTTVIWVKQ
jgi:hypothetical protein